MSRSIIVDLEDIALIKLWLSDTLINVQMSKDKRIRLQQLYIRLLEAEVEHLEEVV